MDHGQVIFQTYPVREPPQRKAGADEIMVLPGAIVSCGIVIDMVVYMILVNVGTYKELILTLRPAHSSFIADPIGLLRGYLSGLERLAYLEEQRPSVSLPARFGLILAMHQQELRMCRGVVAEVRGHSPQFLRVKGIFKPFLHGLDSAFVCRFFVRLYVGCGRRQSSLSVNYASSYYILIHKSEYSFIVTSSASVCWSANRQPIQRAVFLYPRSSTVMK